MTYSDVSPMIDGAWTKGANGRTIPVINPATEEVIGQVAHAEKSDLDRALAAADKGFKQWRKVSAYERYKIMRKAADLMRQRLDEICTIMTTEQGKPLFEAKVETNLAADIIDWMAEEGRRTYGRIAPGKGVPLPPGLEGVTLDTLLTAVKEALTRKPPEPEEAVLHIEPMTVNEKIEEIGAALEQKRGRLRFRPLLAKCETRTEIVVLFMALLEMIKSGHLWAEQERAFGDIVLVEAVKTPA